MTSWIYCLIAVAILLITIARETDTVPASGRRIALMLIPASAALILGLSVVGPWPQPLAAGTFAVTWVILSGFHPGRIWRAQGSPGRRRAFGALWVAIAAWFAVLAVGAV